ncbi:MAG: hypothetical protein JXB47_06250 [Anaerolineae bacterium]|nr:hypothetical protein [Anaerolineae bacterium]
MSKAGRFRWLASRLLVALGSLLVVALAFEILLRVFDPWGMRYFDDVEFAARRYVSDPVRDYVLPAGRYEFSAWRAVVGTDHMRYVCPIPTARPAVPSSCWATR